MKRLLILLALFCGCNSAPTMSAAERFELETRKDELQSAIISLDLDVMLAKGRVEDAEKWADQLKEEQGDPQEQLNASMHAFNLLVASGDLKSELWDTKRKLKKIKRVLEAK